MKKNLYLLLAALLAPPVLLLMAWLCGAFACLLFALSAITLPLVIVIAIYRPLATLINKVSNTQTL